MSKSMGNVMDPIEVAGEFGADSLRYYLLREAPFGRDIDFDYERLINRYNADLANDLGNLFQRTLAMAKKYREGRLAAPAAGVAVTGLPDRGAEVLASYRQAMDRYDLQGGLAAAWELVAAANLAIDTHKPWEIAKDQDRAAELDAVLWELVGALRQLVLLVSPAMPERAQAMAAQLGWSLPPEEWRLAMLEAAAGDTIEVEPGDALFPRLDPADYLEGV
jgi:methionyl-tRNA synthetase